MSNDICAVELKHGPPEPSSRSSALPNESYSVVKYSSIAAHSSRSMYAAPTVTTTSQTQIRKGPYPRSCVSRLQIEQAYPQQCRLSIFLKYIFECFPSFCNPVCLLHEPCLPCYWNLICFWRAGSVACAMWAIPIRLAARSFGLLATVCSGIE